MGNQQSHSPDIKAAKYYSLFKVTEIITWKQDGWCWYRNCL